MSLFCKNTSGEAVQDQRPIFGTDGVRKPYGVWPITPQGAYLLGRAVGAFVCQHVLGQDKAFNESSSLHDHQNFFLQSHRESGAKKAEIALDAGAFSKPHTNGENRIDVSLGPSESGAARYSVKDARGVVAASTTFWGSDQHPRPQDSSGEIQKKEGFSFCHEQAHNGCQTTRSLLCQERRDCDAAQGQPCQDLPHGPIFSWACPDAAAKNSQIPIDPQFYLSDRRIGSESLPAFQRDDTACWKTTSLGVPLHSLAENTLSSGGTGRSDVSYVSYVSLDPAAADASKQYNSCLPWVIIGMDTRLSSPVLLRAVVAGVKAWGLKPVILGVVPTPAVSFAVRHVKAALGLMITASHNPFQDNGIKLFDARGEKLDSAYQDIVQAYMYSQMSRSSAPIDGHVTLGQKAKANHEQARHESIRPGPEIYGEQRANLHRDDTDASGNFDTTGADQAQSAFVSCAGGSTRWMACHSPDRRDADDSVDKKGVGFDSMHITGLSYSTDAESVGRGENVWAFSTPDAETGLASCGGYGFDDVNPELGGHNDFQTDEGRLCVQAYEDFLVHLAGDLSGVSVSVDTAYGALHALAPRVLTRCGARLLAVLGTRPDGWNINHHVGAVYPQVLAQVHTYVCQQAHQISETILQGWPWGFCFDGDGDRVIVVDAQGHVHDGDQIVAALAHMGLHQEGGVVGTLASNEGLARHMAAVGVPFMRAAVGDKAIARTLATQGWVLGGEPAGHVLMRDVLPTGDGLAVALRLLRYGAQWIKTMKKEANETGTHAVNQGPQTIFAKNILGSCQTQSPKVAEHLINHADILSSQRVPLWPVFIPVPSYQNTLSGTQALLDAPGVQSCLAACQEIMQSRQGRMLVRASGTEAVIRVLLECDDRQLLALWSSRVMDVLHAGV